MMHQRIELPYKNESQVYRLNKEDGNKFARRQYIHLYKIRSGLFKERLIKNARRILGVEKLTVLNDLNERNGNEKNVLVVGTVFKRMKFRQSVLYEFADDSNFQEKFIKMPSANLTDDEDVLEFEENQQVLKLVGNIYKHHYVTGDTIGIYGSQEDGTDEFNVKHVILPELVPQIPWPLIEKDCYLVFISGISLSSNVADSYKIRMALDAFQKWINGVVVPADDEEECQIVQNIARLIIAGDWVQLNQPNNAIQWKKVANISMDHEADLECFSAIDRYLLRFLQNLPVDLMPGANDPVQCAIPQQPVPWVVFEAAEKFRPMLNAVTNPYSFSVSGLQFLGTSGQNVNDFGRLTRDIPAMDRMERTLKFGHLFPTVPETLDGFPFGMRDALVIDQIPHVYFCGNQPEFGIKMVDPLVDSYRENGANKNNGKRCLLLAIPKFCETFEAILLNLRTLRAMSYSFNLEWDLKMNKDGEKERTNEPMEN